MQLLACLCHDIQFIVYRYLYDDNYKRVQKQYIDIFVNKGDKHSVGDIYWDDVSCAFVRFQEFYIPGCPVEFPPEEEYLIHDRTFYLTDKTYRIEIHNIYTGEIVFEQDKDAAWKNRNV